MFTAFQLLVMGFFAVVGAGIACLALKVAIERSPAPVGEASMDAFQGAGMARIVPLAATLLAAVVGAPMGMAIEQYIERHNHFPATTLDTIREMSLVAGGGALMVATALALAAIGSILAVARPAVRARAPWLPLAIFFSAGIGGLLGFAALQVIFDYGGFSAFTL